MQRLALSLLTAFCVAHLAAADEPSLPTKAQKLKESYQAALQRVTEPLTKTYLAELEKLKVEHTKAADLQGALAIESEIKVFRPVSSQPSQPTNGSANTAFLNSKTTVEAVVLNTSWESRESNFHVKFLPDGHLEGLMPNTTYAIRDDGIIVYGEGAWKRFMRVRANGTGEFSEKDGYLDTPQKVDDDVATFVAGKKSAKKMKLKR